MKQHFCPRTVGVVGGFIALGLTNLSGVALAQHHHDSSKPTKPVEKSAVSDGAIQSVSRLQEKGMMTVSGAENWEEMTGFGKESTMAEMMTQMMVGGSGMEHMKMGAMKPGMKNDKILMPGMAMEQGLPIVVTLKQNPPVIGDNTLDVLVTDGTGKPITGLKLNATVAMTSMDMGTARPNAKEEKDGHYTMTVNLSMKGPWRVMLTSAPNGNKTKGVATVLDFTVDGKTKWTQPKPAGGMKMPAGGTQTEDWKVTVNTDSKTLKVGKNALDVTFLDASGKPLTGAKVIGVVEMTSMDMGVTKPKAQEGKNGHYTVPVEFSMKGPWRVTLTVTPLKQKPFTKVLDFNVTP